MPELTISAPAKLNLTLDVLSRRPDGYHELAMVMQTVDLCDTVHLRQEGEGPFSVASDLDYLPNDQRNIAAVAARALAEAVGRGLEGLSIRLEKRIPVGAGTAGGSSDGAAVLLGLNRLWNAGLTLGQLMDIGARVGSDVPYCVLKGTARARGRGELLTPLPALPGCAIVMCKPPFSVSTPELFGRIDCRKLRCHPDTEGMLKALAEGDLPGVARRLYNVFEDVVPAHRRGPLADIRETLLRHGALGACMSGTGPTVFGLFDREERAGAAWEELSARYSESYLTHPVGGQEEF